MSDDFFRQLQSKTHIDETTTPPPVMIPKRQMPSLNISLQLGRRFDVLSSHKNSYNSHLKPSMSVFSKRHKRKLIKYIDILLKKPDFFNYYKCLLRDTIPQMLTEIHCNSKTIEQYRKAMEEDTLTQKFEEIVLLPREYGLEKMKSNSDEFVLLLIKKLESYLVDLNKL